MTNSRDASCCRELTDEQSFREMVESLVAFRSDTEKRRFPRFPTAAALSGRLGLRGFDGTLVVGEVSSSAEAGWNHDGEGRRRGAGIEEIGVNFVEFSEGGAQLQLRYNDFLHLQRSSLYLKIQNHRVPVQLRWWKQCGYASRGGFIFANRIDSDTFLAQFISNLNTDLIDFLMSTYLNGLAAFTKPAGVFIYMAIYYGLRLKFLEAVAEHSTSPGFGKNERTSKIPVTTSDDYSCSYHMAQIIQNRSDSLLQSAVRKYIKPYNDIGCSIIGMHEDVVLLKEEANSTILNSILFTKDDCQYSTKILPKLSFLHHNFLQLKRLLVPGVFEGDIFEIQFRYYSNVIQRIDLARKITSQGSG